MDVQHATPDGSAAKQRRSQSKLAVAQDYLTLAKAVRASRDSAAVTPVVWANDNDGIDAMTATNTAAANTMYTGVGGGASM